MRDISVFAQNVYATAKRKGITIQRIEEGAQLSAGYLSHMKNRDWNPSLHVAAAVADVLGEPLDSLLGDSVKE